MSASERPVVEGPPGERIRPDHLDEELGGRGFAGTLLRALVALIAVGVVYVSLTFVQVWLATGRHDGGPVDAIVVLGAAQYDGTPSPVLRDRLDHAFELWSAGEAELIVVTGGSQPDDRLTEGQAGYLYLRNLGVPDDELVVIVDGEDTWESLVATARVLHGRDLDEVLLVSDPYHNLRLLGTAEEVGLDASVDSTDANVSMTRVLRETGAVSVGRLIGYHRLIRLLG